MDKSQPAPQPVKSAKDAINAMYAKQTGLGDYLASSAQEIINASATRKAGAHQSASSLHRRDPGRHESVRPSASALLRPATSSKSLAPAVVRTSLKLGPKQPPLISPPTQSALPQAARPTALRAKKTPLALRPTQSTPAKTSTPRPASAQPPATAARKPAPRPAPTTNPHVFQDIARPARSARPLDSIKNRFRPAPKDYVIANPQTILSTQPPTSPLDDAVASAHSQAMATPSPAPLGVVEDYGDPIAHKSDQPARPDDNRYALNRQSPFFLQSATIDKRPLSGGPSTQTQIATTLQSGQTLPSKSSKPRKNHYDHKPKPLKSSKSTTRPDQLTVIIPAHHRSQVPIFILILLTVIIGAAVGALAYLFLFQ